MALQLPRVSQIALQPPNDVNSALASHRASAMSTRDAHRTAEDERSPMALEPSSDMSSAQGQQMAAKVGIRGYKYNTVNKVVSPKGISNRDWHIDFGMLDDANQHPGDVMVVEPQIPVAPSSLGITNIRNLTNLEGTQGKAFQSDPQCKFEDHALARTAVGAGSARRWLHRIWHQRQEHARCSVRRKRRGTCTLGAGSARRWLHRIWHQRKEHAKRLVKRKRRGTCTPQGCLSWHRCKPRQADAGAQGNLKVMRRETVTLVMKGAAVDWGLKRKHVATHSIRISGATALLIAGVPAEVVKIMGRWISNAFIGDTRYQAELMAGISQRMVNTSYMVRPF